TSGSQAALSMTVTPWASVAAIITLAVPRTVEPARPPKKYGGAHQPLCAGRGVAAFDHDFRPQSGEAFEVQIHRARSDHATPRQGNGRLFEPAEQRPHYADRAAHFAN